jgi:predicted enzyme related to lactoylglutathione lyase
MARVVHFEIHAENPERAVKFYAAVFGWKFEKWGGPMEYWTICTGDPAARGIDGGLVRRRGPSPVEGQCVNSFVCTIDVTSVDATESAVKVNGGTVALPKMAVPTIGWLTYFKDTEGNIFGAMQRDANAK